MFLKVRNNGFQRLLKTKIQKFGFNSLMEYIHDTSLEQTSFTNKLQRKFFFI